jgi:hypothetical protein
MRPVFRYLHTYVSGCLRIQYWCVRYLFILQVEHLIDRRSLIWAVFDQYSELTISVADPRFFSRILIFIHVLPSFVPVVTNTRITKFKIIYFEQVQKILSQFIKNYRTVLCTQNIVTKLSKIWVWDPEKSFPDPRSRCQKGIGSRIRIRNTANFRTVPGILPVLD